MLEDQRRKASCLQDLKISPYRKSILSLNAFTLHPPKLF